MERQSKQKIAFACLLAGTAVLLAVIFFCNSLYVKETLKEQKMELSVIYPELSEALSNNISYYAHKNLEMNFVIMLVVMALMVVVMISAYALLSSGTRRIIKEREEELNYISDQLRRFQNGGEMLPFPHQSRSQKFEYVHDRLAELEYYCSNLKEKLEHEENSTKELITDISHQLKTPLASIKMSHDLSLTSEFSEEERQSFLEAETVEIQKMEALLDELVKLSRLENSMIQIKCEKCSIKETISEAVSQVYIKASTKHIEICVDMETDAETMHDHRWTVEALVNILENAVKYSEPETAINITVSRLVNCVLIQVEDQGIGIPEGELHEIFKRFYRGSNAKKVSKEGAGVGLYLSRKIIEQQGGTIVAKRKNNSGTVFQIMLPLSDS